MFYLEITNIDTLIRYYLHILLNTLAIANYLFEWQQFIAYHPYRCLVTL